MKCILFISAFSLFSVFFAQNERGIARDGNGLYADSLYQESEVQYRKSLSENSSFSEAKFNLSNSLFKQSRYSESIDLLRDIVKTTNDSVFQSEAYYNMGNNYIMMADNESQDTQALNESLQNAVGSYKKCLKINPSDEEARHNLSKALRRLQENKENQNNDDQESDDDKKEKQNSGQTDGEDEDKKDSEEKNKENNESKEGGGQSNSDQKKQGDNKGELLDSQLSKEDMNRILEALDRKEKDVQEKMRKINFSKQKNKEIEKDW